MTSLRGKPAMLATYCEEIKVRGMKLRALREALAKKRTLTDVRRLQHQQYVLQIEVRCLLDLRRKARALGRARAEARAEQRRQTGVAAVQ